MCFISTPKRIQFGLSPGTEKPLKQEWGEKKLPNYKSKLTATLGFECWSAVFAFVHRILFKIIIAMIDGVLGAVQALSIVLIRFFQDARKRERISWLN